jgi:hypothetical protein
MVYASVSVIWGSEAFSKRSYKLPTLLYTWMNFETGAIRHVTSLKCVICWESGSALLSAVTRNNIAPLWVTVEQFAFPQTPPTACTKIRVLTSENKTSNYCKCYPIVVQPDHILRKLSSPCFAPSVSCLPVTIILFNVYSNLPEYIKIFQKSNLFRPSQISDNVGIIIILWRICSKHCQASAP